MEERLSKGNKLYDLYYIISNKTVRQHENFYKKFRKHRNVPGVMVITNRGYFIDGYNVDRKSAKTWFELVIAARKKK